MSGISKEQITKLASVLRTFDRSYLKGGGYFGKEEKIIDLYSESQIVAILKEAASIILDKNKIAQFKALSYLRQLGLLTQIFDFCSKREINSFGPDWVDLALLHEALFIRRPRRILELGSGLSTCIIQNYCFKTGASADILDYDSYWGNSTFEALGNVTNLKRLEPKIKSAQLRFSPTDLREVQFHTLNGDIYDFIYLDAAPSESVLGGAEVFLFNETLRNPGTWVQIDCRDNTWGAFHKLKNTHNLHALSNFVAIKLKPKAFPALKLFDLDPPSKDTRSVVLSASAILPRLDYVNTWWFFGSKSY